MGMLGRRRVVAGVATGLVGLMLGGVALAAHGLTTTSATSASAEIQRYRAAVTNDMIGPDPALSWAPSPFPSAVPTRVPAARPVGLVVKHQLAPAAAPSCDWACPSDRLPAPGVYHWFQCGRTDGQCSGAGDEPKAGESLAGSHRDFPRDGYRTVTLTGPTSWTMRHAYAQEHQDEYSLDYQGGVLHMGRYRSLVTYLGVTQDTDILPDPMAVPFRFPLHVGEAWGGHWKDRNGNADADYTITVRDRAILHIGGADVRTWVVDFDTSLRGPHVTGRNLVRQWIAPQFALSVQEQYTEDVSRDGAHYQGRWMETVADVGPAR